MTIEFARSTDIPGLKRLWSRCFGDPESVIDAFFDTGFAFNRCRCIRAGDRIAAGLHWFDVHCNRQPFAYLYAVATDPEFQKQGLCRMLLADTHRLLREAGYGGVILVPGNEGLFTLYEKMGYRRFGSMRIFSCDCANTAVALRQISKTEYTAMRQTLLPAGGVVQEGPALDWLETISEFYCGDGFLLAAAKDGGQLLVQELLGDSAVAPGIVTALGAKTGRFRTPGGEAPFAMYYPLTQTEPPAYFGLALD